MAEAQKANEDLKASYAALQGSLDKSIQQNSQGNINISKLVDEINASNKFIKQLVEAKDSAAAAEIEQLLAPWPDGVFHLAVRAALPLEVAARRDEAAGR